MKLQLYLCYVVRRHGIGRLGALSLGLFSILWLLCFTLPEREKIVLAEAQVVHLANIREQQAPLNLEQSPEVAVAAFYAGLPSETAWTQQLETLFDAAFEHDVYLNNVEYKQEEDAEGRLSLYKVVLPVTATYLNTRAFIKELLEKLPNAALDQIVLSRDDDKPEIDAKLQFTLYFRQ